MFLVGAVLLIPSSAIADLLLVKFSPYDATISGTGDVGIYNFSSTIGDPPSIDFNLGGAWGGGALDAVSTIDLALDFTSGTMSSTPHISGNNLFTMTDSGTGLTMTMAIMGVSVGGTGSAMEATFLGGGDASLIFSLDEGSIVSNLGAPYEAADTVLIDKITDPAFDLTSLGGGSVSFTTLASEQVIDTFTELPSAPELPVGATSAVLALLGFGVLAIRKQGRKNKGAGDQ